MTETATHPSLLARRRPFRRPGLRLALHYLEMVAAMSVGMAVFGMLRDLAGLTVSFDAHPGTSYLLMATDMALGMAAWMRIRGHAWGETLEMCAAMYVPVLLLPLVWAGAMAPMTFMVAVHILMLVAMLAVMLRRRDQSYHC